MASKRSQVLAWIEDGVIASGHTAQALEVTGVTPDGLRWCRFLDQLLLVLGVLSLAIAAVFFVAYNWDALGRSAQFALVQALLVVAVFFYWRLGVENTSAKVVLLGAAILLGVLLAFYGQTYQTGSDPWQLFAAWGLLMLPWVLVGRYAPLWLLWITLLNIAFTLYFQTFHGLLWVTFGSEDELLWCLFLFNSMVWVLWEWAAMRFGWLGLDVTGRRWAVRLIATASGTVITMLVLRAVFDSPEIAILPWLAYGAWLAALYLVYRRRLPDLFMLAGACLSLIVIVTSVLARIMLKGSSVEIYLLLLAVLVVAQAAAAAVWLRRINAEHSS